MDKSPGEKLAALLGDSLEAKVEGKVGSFGGLLSREAAILLLCQENGISAERKLVLSEARGSLLPFSFSARVDRVFPVQQFPGGAMRTVRLHVSDRSGEATLVLWNEQAKLAETIFAGDEVECSGAYVRAGEISIGRNGSIARAGKGRMLGVAELWEGACNVSGTVEKAGAVRTYADRKTGEEKRMLSFTLCGGGKCCRAIWWSPPADAPQLREGAQVALQGATFRRGELHLNGFSRVSVQPGGGQEGKFAGVSIEGSDAVVRLGGKDFRMGVGEALSLLGIPPAPQGVMASTLLSIKAAALEGKDARYVLEGARLVSLRLEG